VFTDHIKIVLSNIIEIPEVDFNKENISSSLRKVSEENKVHFAKLMKSLRCALSGLKVRNCCFVITLFITRNHHLQEGPGVAESMEILKRDSVIKRLQRTVSVLQKNTAKRQVL